MKADRFTTLDDLPMFATDKQIAQAIVGPQAAEKWLKERLPTLASKPGFPKIDDFHGGRPVRLVKKFYDSYLGSPDNPDRAGRPDGIEDESAWNSGRRRRA